MSEAKKELVFVRWYTMQAVYLDGKLLVYMESGANWVILDALGYSCRNYEEVPTHNIPPEFDRTLSGGWNPPAALATLEGQFAAWRRRKKQERIAECRRELERLEADE